MQTKFPIRIMLPIYMIVLVVCALLAHGGSEAITVMVEHSPIPSRTCIVIDAGHGGIDGGAISCTGKAESNINLQIAQRLNDFMHLLGYQTIMLRTDDTSLHTEGKTIAQQKISDLKNRVQTVNEIPNAILISIHQNSFSDSRYSGAQVFYASNDRSKEFASQLQTSFTQTINPLSTRKAKPAKGIYLIERCTCPAILVECGFLSNPEEESMLSDPDYQKKIIAVIGCTSSIYCRNSMEKSGPTTSDPI